MSTQTLSQRKHSFGIGVNPYSQCPLRLNGLCAYNAAQMASPTERYAHAVQSRNLRGSDIAVVDIDTLTAAGWAGSGSKAASLGAILHRARATRCATAINAAQVAVAAYAVTAARRLRLATTRSPAAAAAAVLAWLLRPACRVCTGRRFAVVPHTGRLSAVACPACRGTGLARTPYAGDPLAEYLHTMLEMKMEVFSRHMARRLIA